MLSICIALKNRSRVKVDRGELLLFPNCVRSIVQSVPRTAPCELVVADWNSEDWPLDEWLEEAAHPVPVRIVRVRGSFSRGRGLNLAAAAADADYLFFTDADSLVCPDLFMMGMRYVKQGKAYFPVLYSFDGPEHQSGWWRRTGYGNCMVTRNTFEQAGRWPEYNTWGREDDHFVARVSQVCEIAREEVPGFFHQWHPDDILWKDRYANRDPAEIEEIQQSRVALEELAAIVPPGSTVLLVDEARFGVDDINGRPALPFLEKNGEYAGPPEDDVIAIAELDRMRANGARFLAVMWPAFWWLQYYAVFAKHLHDKYRLVLENERLLVFDLHSHIGM